MRTYQARLAVDDDAPLRKYAAVFSHALRSLHASRHAGNVESKPRFMRAFGLTSRQYNAVKFSLDGMESSIVELRPGRIADLSSGSNPPTRSWQSCSIQRRRSAKLRQTNLRVSRA
jgi:hypothetical protein